MTIKNKLIALSGVILLTGLVAVPVSARQGSDDVSSPTATTDTSLSGSGSGSNSPDSSSTETEHPAAEVEAENHVSELIKNDAQKTLDDMGNDHKNKRSDEERKKNCHEHEHGLETKLGNLNKNAVKHLARIDGIYASALDYQKNHNLSPSNFAEMKSQADSAALQAKASTAVLAGLSVNVDCSSGSVAKDVSTFKAATAQVRTDLKAYKEAVKAVLHSLETAKGDKE